MYKETLLLLHKTTSTPNALLQMYQETLFLNALVTVCCVRGGPSRGELTIIQPRSPNLVMHRSTCAMLFGLKLTPYLTPYSINKWSPLPKVAFRRTFLKNSYCNWGLRLNGAVFPPRPPSRLISFVKKKHPLIRLKSPRTRTLPDIRNKE